MVALLAMLGAFLLPIFAANIRGITHVLTCREQVETPFTVIIEEGKRPQILSSKVIKRNDPGLCGGLAVDFEGGGSSSSDVEMRVSIQNNTRALWKGTVQLVLEQTGRKTTIPVAIGSIPAGKAAEDSVSFSLDPGTHEMGGSLLIGP